MTSNEEAADERAPLLEIELLEIANGCLARLRGDLVSETRAGLWSIEPMLANEARVALDVSGVTSIDGLGLEAALRLMNAVHIFGGTVIFGAEHALGDLAAPAPTLVRADASPGVLGRLNVHPESANYHQPLW